MVVQPVDVTGLRKLGRKDFVKLVGSKSLKGLNAMGRLGLEGFFVIHVLSLFS